MIKIDYKKMTHNELTTTINEIRKELEDRGTITTFNEIHYKTKKILKKH